MKRLILSTMLLSFVGGQSAFAKNQWWPADHFVDKERCKSHPLDDLEKRLCLASSDAIVVEDESGRVHVIDNRYNADKFETEFIGFTNPRGDGRIILEHP